LNLAEDTLPKEWILIFAINAFTIQFVAVDATSTHAIDLSTGGRRHNGGVVTYCRTGPANRDSNPSTSQKPGLSKRIRRRREAMDEWTKLQFSAIPFWVTEQMATLARRNNPCPALSHPELTIPCQSTIPGALPSAPLSLELHCAYEVPSGNEVKRSTPQDRYRMPRCFENRGYGLTPFGRCQVFPVVVMILLAAFSTPSSPV